MWQKCLTIFISSRAYIGRNRRPTIVMPQLLLATSLISILCLYPFTNVVIKFTSKNTCLGYNLVNNYCVDNVAGQFKMSMYNFNGIKTQDSLFIEEI